MGSQVRPLAVLGFVAATTILGACESSSPPPESHYSNWEHYGLTHSEQRHSPLTQIDSGNVHQLGLAWSQDIPGARTLQATPMAVDGVLYYTTDWGLEVYAVDGETGDVIWKYQTEPENPAALRLHMGANRGAAHENGKIFAAVGDGRLNALDARSGELIWSVRTFPKEEPRFITGAPRVFNGKVIIGHGGGDTGARGYVSTYDAASGELIWRFYTVPGNPADGFEDAAMEMAAKTWSGEWWRHGGGGTAWNALTYDPDFNQIYIGTGNSGPYSPAIRSPGGNGDNLFLCSIVAVDADTGEYRWHYQVNPREAWDFKATMDIVLADLKIDGVDRKVLMQAPTNGFFYVIDRASGELISAEKWGGKVNWAERIDLDTGRPVERANIRYEDGEPEHIWPGTFGAHNYQPMSFNPETGLVYIPHLEAGMIMGTVTPEAFETDEIRTGYKYIAQTGATFGGLLLDSENGGKGSLVAWDPVSQSERWRVVTDSFWNGGTLTTAGNLVFYGTATGQFSAYDASSGEELWSFNAGLGIVSAPMSYAIGATQYISILVGYGGSAGSGIPVFKHGWKFGLQPRRLLTFTLAGERNLPETPPPDTTVTPVLVEGFEPEAEKVQRGIVIYHTTCAHCHGGLLASESVAPDLRESTLSSDLDAFSALLRNGPLAQRGMPLYDDLTEADIEGLYHYVRHGAATVGQETDDLDMDDCTFCGITGSGPN